jgi:hypothetical protein
MQESSPRYEWDPTVPVHHRQLVESGTFDSMDQPEAFEHDEFVVARRNGFGYHVEEIGDGLVRIWYKTGDTETEEIVSRNDVRPANSYVQAYAEITRPGVEVTVDKAGLVVVKMSYSLLTPSASRPTHSGSWN